MRSSNKIVLFGWFEWFHMELQDIGHFKQYFKMKFGDMGQELKFNVHVQQVQVGKGDKTIIHALAFVVDLEQRDLGSCLIEGITFDGSYGRLYFHPFVNQKTIAHNLVQNIFKNTINTKNQQES